jgi:hypothetical protein
MSSSQILLTGVIGAAAGFLGGLLGIGGAIIIVPALIMLFGYSQQMAQGTTLVMLSLPVSAMAAWQYYKTGNADIKIALLLGITFFVSGFIGAKFANQIPEAILKKLFAILLLALSIKMLFIDKKA